MPSQTVSSRPACCARARMRKSMSFAVAGLLAITLAGGAAQAQSTVPGDTAPAASDKAEEPWRTDRFYLETSLYTHHFHSDPAHVNKQKLILGEWNITEQWLLGASVFDNSFGQRSEYVYGGWRYRPFERAQPFYLKVSAGLVHGYKDAYRDKIPLNQSGVAPVIGPSLG